MRFDVSEMKTANECGRKWQLSSRNAFHMRPKVTNPNLSFGSLFHECLHTLYLGGNIDKVIQQAVQECEGDPTQQKVIESMLRGYYDNVLIHDLEQYQVLDIEHSVKFYIPTLMVYDDTTGELDEDKSVQVCGSIDMICVEKATHRVYGFEHKTASKFRPDIYIAVDEQPRVYFIELQNFVRQLNEEYYVKYKEQGPYSVGGIYINEVKKVQRKFEYQRRLCYYGPTQVESFMHRLDFAGRKIRAMRDGKIACNMSPSYMGCQMCDFAPICQMYGYGDLDKDTVLEEFVEEYEVRTEDHLDEKVERRIEG